MGGLKRDNQRGLEINDNIDKLNMTYLFMSKVVFKMLLIENNSQLLN